MEFSSQSYWLQTHFSKILSYSWEWRICCYKP